MRAGLRYAWPLLAAVLLAATLLPLPVAGQSSARDRLSLALDLRAAKARYDDAADRLAAQRRLIDASVGSERDLAQVEYEFVAAEVAYQKVLLALMATESRLVLERAVRTESATGIRVALTLRNAAPNETAQLEEHRAVLGDLSASLRQGTIRDGFVSLLEPDAETVIGLPYEAPLPGLDAGESTTVHFRLLRDVDRVQVALDYSGRETRRTVLLERPAGTRGVELDATPVSQEAELGSAVNYSLSLTSRSSGDARYRLAVAGLPEAVGRELVDPATGARLALVQLPAAGEDRRLLLRLRLPARPTEDLVIDRSVEFVAGVLSPEDYEALTVDGLPSVADLSRRALALASLTVVARGVPELELAVENLYYEIETRAALAFQLTARNSGSGPVRDVTLAVDAPRGWTTTVDPARIAVLEAGEDRVVQIDSFPPEDTGSGVREVRVSASGSAHGGTIEAERRTIRVSVERPTPLALIIGLAIGLVVLVGGIVVFGIRLTRR